MYSKKETNINLNALPLAREEYEKQLQHLLQPLITKGFWSIYNDSKKICEKENKQHETFKRFQYFVKKIRQWSNLIVDAETERIKSKISCLSELITIIFVGNVKILASIRLKGKHANIKIKVPSCNNFIHSVYINTAKRIFYDPMLFDHTLDPIQKEQNMNRVYGFIEKAISETISQMLPLDNILNEYLGNCFNEVESETESEHTEEEEGESLYGDDIKSESDEEETPLKLPSSSIDFGNKIPSILQNKKPSIPQKSLIKTQPIQKPKQSEEEQSIEQSIEQSEEEQSEEEQSEEEQSEEEQSEKEQSEEESEEEDYDEETDEEEPPFKETGPKVQEEYKKPLLDRGQYEKAFRKEPVKFNMNNFQGQQNGIGRQTIQSKFNFNKSKFFENRAGMAR